MDNQTIGGFSCDATTPSGNAPYYALAARPGTPPFQPLECESLQASRPYAYYGLETAPTPLPGQRFPTPNVGVVPNPDGGSTTAPPIVYPVGQTTSKAFSVGPYGSAAPVQSSPASYAMSAIQYAKNSSYFVPTANAGPNPPPPPPPPSGAPSGPPFGIALAAPATQTAIPVIFDTAGIIGTPPLIYEVYYTLADGSNPQTVLAQPVLVTVPGSASTLYTAAIQDLQPSTGYIMTPSVRNGFGKQVGTSGNYSTLGPQTAPTGTLTTPTQFASADNTSITVIFTAENVKGNPAPSYNMYWGLAPNQYPTSLSAGLIPGTTNQYVAVLTPATPGTDYYFRAFATNGVSPDLVSGNAGPFRTATGTSPNKAPPAPVVSGTPTVNSITMTVDVTGITGTPTPSYILYADTVSPPITNGVSVPMTVSGNTASATVADLSGATNYYFQAVAANGVPTDKTGPVSAAVRTAGGGAGTAPNGPQGTYQPVVDPKNPPTDTTVNLILLNVDKLRGTPWPTTKLYYTPFSSSTEPATFPGAPFIPINLPQNYPSTTFVCPQIAGLLAGTQYYFQVAATNGVSPDFFSGVSFATTAGTPSPTNTPPSGPPTAPNASEVTATTITGIFSIAGVTGNPAPAYSLGFSTAADGPFTYIPTTDLSGSTFGATITGLKPSTTYYLVSKASNGVAPDQISASSMQTTSAAPPPSALKTNLVAPFFLQGPRYGSTPGAWTAIDYYINTAAVGATYQVGATAASGQQIFASMYAGTIGDAGNATGGSPPCQYAGACIADVPFAALGGSGAANYSDTYLKAVQTHMGSQGRVLTSWGGYLADILGLFGPYVPKGFPADAQPTSVDIVKSFLYNYCGVGGANPLNWKRTNTSGNSGYTFYFDGLVLDFENVGNGNYQNNYPYPPPAKPPTTQELNRQSMYQGYVQALGDIPATYYEFAPDLFLGNAPASLSIVSDQGQTNICAANTAFGTWFPFLTATEAPTAGGYNKKESLALNHPQQLSYMDDIFVQFYNESADYYLGGQYFSNLVACWGYVALEAQKLGRKKTTINIGLARGNIIAGNPNGVGPGNPAIAAAQGPTPPLAPVGQKDPGAPPYTYWFPQYAQTSPPNNTDNADYETWPNNTPTVDPQHLAGSIEQANVILRTAQNNQNLQVSDWCSGAGFWAGSEATRMAQRIYNPSDSASPAQYMNTPNTFPAKQTYCWSDASYPAPDTQWALQGSGGTTYLVPIQNNQ